MLREFKMFQGLKNKIVIKVPLNWDQFSNLAPPTGTTDFE